MSRRGVVLVLVATLLLLQASPAFARPYWKKRIDRAVGGASMGVAVRLDDRQIYGRRELIPRPPASVEKLLMTMPLFAALGPGSRLRTFVKTDVGPVAGIVHGNLWMIGRGDPTLTSGGRYAHAFPFAPTRIHRIALALKNMGIVRIDGRVMGHTGYFAHDWWAQGWEANFPAEEVALPTALTVQGNSHEGRHIDDPERRAARALMNHLEDIGVSVSGKPGAGRAPLGLMTMDSFRSQPLHELTRFMNRQSSNFFAEVLGKRLGAAVAGRPGTIRKGASAIESWAAQSGVAIDAFDSSGLSYSNSSSPRAVTRLLARAEDEPWWGSLRRGLAGAGQGTLEDRLDGVKLRAKTGTLSYTSSLAGWVWLEKRDTWAAFAILSQGLTKTRAAQIENEIVRVLHRFAR